MEFHERLLYLRKQKGMTQLQLANELNVTRSSISYYENGERNPDLDTIQKIADIFNVSTDYLLGRTDNPSHVILGEGEIPYELMDLGYEYLVVIKEAKETGLTPDELQELIDFAKKMKKIGVNT